MARDDKVHEVRTYRVSLYKGSKVGQEEFVEEVTVTGRPVTPFAKGMELAYLRPADDFIIKVEVVDAL